MPDERAALLQGTLDMLILRSLAGQRRHGYGVACWIETQTRDALEVEEGSLYPALHRMERRGWVSSEWGLSETNRRARYYCLTRKGEKQLHAEMQAWDRLVAAITLVLQATPAEVAP